MRTRIHHLAHDERGMSLVFLGVCMASFIAVTTLAIDVGMFMNARTQAQNSADAGALAGATALAFTDFNNRSASGPAVQSAINAAKKNTVMGGVPTVAMSDVTFPAGPTGVSNRVQVDVHRAGDNAVPTVMGAWFGVNSVNINTSATAEASPANAMTCVKPFMIPDKWEEVGNPPWDPSDTFDMYDNSGNLLPPNQKDIYIPVRNCPTCKDNPAYTGYTIAKDQGQQLILRQNNSDKVNPSFYFSWKMPGDIGGDFYRDNISGCNVSLVHWFDLMTQEPGDKSGPTNQGIDDLIAKDPNAVWNASCKCVQNSAYPGQSPRVFPIPLYDPAYYATGKANGRDADFRIANFLGFFVDQRSGNQVYGYITTVTGVVDGGAGAAPAGMFPVDIRLVK